MRYGPLLSSLVILFSSSLHSFAQAQDYPNKPIHLVVAFAAGGIADTMARLLSNKLALKWATPILVENKSGAGGNIAAKSVAMAEPDGYTFLVTTAAIAINPSLYKSAGYNVNDLAPVALTASTPNLFAVGISNAANNLQDLARLYKGKQLTYSTAGIGSSSHLTAQYVFVNLMGMDAIHVPYQGGAPGVNAAIAGHVDLTSVSMPAAMSNVTGGRLKGIAIASLKRVDALPNTPTISESGLGEYEDRSWIGVFAPNKTNPEIIKKLNMEINEIIKQNDVHEKLIASGFEPNVGSPLEFATYLRQESAKWALIVKSTKITLND